MEKLIEFVTTQDWVAWFGAISALLGALYTVALLIPGDQPDKTIKWILDVTKNLSRK